MLKKDGRFEFFVLNIDAIHKSIGRVKQDIIADTELKGVHTLWLYELWKNRDGLTSAQLAAKSNIDRSLVSREVRFLMDSGYITLAGGAKKRGYNTRLLLTDLGRELGEEIFNSAKTIQTAVGDGISDEELSVFYDVLSRLNANFDKLCKDSNNKI